MADRRNKCPDTRDKRQETRHKTQDTRHKRHRTQTSSDLATGGSRGRTPGAGPPAPRGRPSPGRAAAPSSAPASRTWTLEVATIFRGGFINVYNNILRSTFVLYNLLLSILIKHPNFVDSSCLNAHLLYAMRLNRLLDCELRRRCMHSTRRRIGAPSENCEYYYQLL